MQQRVHGRNTFPCMVGWTKSAHMVRCWYLVRLTKVLWAAGLIYMTPGHLCRIRAVRLDICTPPPHQAYQYTSRQVLNQHRIGGESERLGWLYMSPLSITTLPIHITPGLNSTSDWWHFRAVRFGFHDSNPAGNRAIRKNTETRIAAGNERLLIGLLCFPSGCFKKPASKQRKTGNGKMCFHPVLWMAKIPAQQRLAVGITPQKVFFQLIGMDVLLNKSRQFHDDFVTLSYAFSICPIPWYNIQANYIVQHQWRWGRYTNTSWAYSLKLLTLYRNFIDLYNGQVKPHLKILRQCP